jgi:hypothetical protein
MGPFRTIALLLVHLPLRIGRPLLTGTGAHEHHKDDKRGGESERFHSAVKVWNGSPQGNIDPKEIFLHLHADNQCSHGGVVAARSIFHGNVKTGGLRIVGGWRKGLSLRA